ncbi:MAG: hypothetical protein JSW38_10795 [Dehalococcoidia bacterium]|nr:MAG: hypothetical protein JSV02_09925 [Dehalococcoidia bacterium]UCG82659.1 MAG: hypothetical protein JSW38_10795 [Dehalococcoidia bacterium]
MADYRFERECRTPHSEAYLITEGDDRVGRVDLHFTPSIVYATLCVTDKFTEDDIQELIYHHIDEELVMSADVARDDFIVTVFQGREVNEFSDEDFDEEEEEED